MKRGTNDVSEVEERSKTPFDDLVRFDLRYLGEGRLCLTRKSPTGPPR